MSTIVSITEDLARGEGRSAGYRRALDLLDVIAEAAKRHHDTVPMTVPMAAKMLRHALAFGYDPAQIVVTVGSSPFERADQCGMALPGSPSWLCWQSEQDRKSADVPGHLDRMMARPSKVRDLELPLLTSIKTTT